jgi:hypothetical protein
MLSRKIRSGRTKGAVGTKPTKVTQFILDEAVHGTYGLNLGNILDFGCGKYYQQVKYLDPIT